MTDGKSIVTGWTDGRVRAFTPQSGRLLYIIQEAHRASLPSPSQVSGVSVASQYSSIVPPGVTCLAPSIDCKHLLTGGHDGEVRLW